MIPCQNQLLDLQLFCNSADMDLVQEILMSGLADIPDLDFGTLDWILTILLHIHTKGKTIQASFFRD